MATILKAKTVKIVKDKFRPYVFIEPPPKKGKKKGQPVERLKLALLLLNYDDYADLGDEDWRLKLLGRPVAKKPKAPTQQASAPAQEAPPVPAMWWRRGAACSGAVR